VVEVGSGGSFGTLWRVMSRFEQRGVAMIGGLILALVALGARAEGVGRRGRRFRCWRGSLGLRRAGE